MSRDDCQGLMYDACVDVPMEVLKGDPSEDHGCD